MTKRLDPAEKERRKVEREIAWKEQHGDEAAKKREKRHAYYLKNKDRQLESHRRWAQENPEKVREYSRKHWLKTRGPIVIKEPVTRQQQLDRMSQWRIDNHERFKVARNRWSAENPERVRMSKLKYEIAKSNGCLPTDIPEDLLIAEFWRRSVNRKVKELSK